MRPGSREPGREECDRSLRGHLAPALLSWEATPPQGAARHYADALGRRRACCGPGTLSGTGAEPRPRGVGPARPSLLRCRFAAAAQLPRSGIRLVRDSVATARGPRLHWGANPGPSACKADVLSTALWSHVLAKTFLNHNSKGEVKP